jgi:hypothetical protein
MGLRLEEVEDWISILILTGAFGTWTSGGVTEADRAAEHLLREECQIATPSRPSGSRDDWRTLHRDQERAHLFHSIRSVCISPLLKRAIDDGILKKSAPIGLRGIDRTNLQLVRHGN